MAEANPAPTLILAWGNPSRGDDALGPCLADAIESRRAAHPEWGAVEVLTDFQLHVEHVLDLRGRQRVLFADAHCALPRPCTLTRLTADAPASADGGLASHALSPAALLRTWQRIERTAPPPCWLLAMRAESMTLGATLSATARASLAAAIDTTSHWLAQPTSAPGPTAHPAIR